MLAREAGTIQLTQKCFTTSCWPAKRGQSNQFPKTYLISASNNQPMKSVALLIALFCIGLQVKAQKVYSVDYENQAEVKVFVVQYENQADLKVCKVKYENQAGENDGKWFFTNYANQAKKKIYFVKYENQADVKIYFVNYENQAGWRNNSKKHYFY
jgi:hypothetical protein